MMRFANSVTEVISSGKSSTIVTTKRMKENLPAS